MSARLRVIDSSLPPGRASGHPAARVRIGLSVLLAVVVAVGAGLVALSPASAATPAPGYGFTNPTYTGLDPAGVVVRVLVSSPHAPLLFSSAAVVTAELRSTGLDVRWSGLKLDPGTGITISEGSVGCGPGMLGNTWPRMMPGIGSRLAQSGAYVELCPAAIAAGGWTLAETLRHEMGHAVGLAHTVSTLGGRHQTMYPTLSPADLRYGPGDLDGFRAIAALSRSSRLLWPANGHVDGVFGGPGLQVTVQGWALPMYPSAAQAYLFVYDNGVLRSAIPTNTYRADVNRVYDPSTTIRHGFDVAFPASAGNNTVCIQVSTASSARTALGCWTMTLAA